MDCTFKPLYGAHGGGPLSYLLQLNGFTLLLDCGWGDPYDPAALEPLLAIADTIDAVLLSHPDPLHLGALPALIGRVKLPAAVYATGAIHKMGQMFMYSTYLTRHACSDFSAFDLDDVDAAFTRITQLRYRQEVALPGKGAGISITPLPAGRLVGGTVWRITVGGEEFVYAVDFNHRRERHLNGTALEASFLRPACLIADAAAVGRPPADREHAERALIDACMAALRADGNVLIPIDAAGRLLELVLVLEAHWAEHRLPYPLALVGPMVHTTMEFARSQLEWMNEALVKSFGHSKDNPFTLRHVKLCSTLAELRKLPPGPRVVLAVEPSLGFGPARHLFAEWAPDPMSAIILALDPPPHSLAAAAVAAAAERDARPGGGAGLPPPLLHVSLSKRVPLKGEELQSYLEEEAKRKEEEEASAAAAAAMQVGTGDGVAGGSPRSGGASGKSPAVPTRANVASIGHAGRDAAGVGLGLGGTSGDGGLGLGLGLGLDSVMEEADEGFGVACLVEGFEVAEGAAAPMFPAEDGWEGMEFDEYGAVVDFADFEGAGAAVNGQLGRALASEAEAERGLGGAGAGEGGGCGSGGAAPGAASVEEEEASEAQIPTKIETREQAVPLAARVVRVDFEGRSDGRSVQTMLAHVAPRTAILVHADREASAALAARLESELEGLHAVVATPGTGDEVAVPVGPSFEIELSDKMARAADMHAVSGYELAWVDGQLEAPERAGGGGAGGSGGGGDEGGGGEGLLVLVPRTDSSGSGTAGTAAVASTSAAAAAGPSAVAATDGPSYGGVFIGDVRLSELKKALALAGVRAEFHGGALYCAGQVVVKRRGGEGGGLVLEGALGDAYYKVREVVYGQYHVC